MSGAAYQLVDDALSLALALLAVLLLLCLELFASAVALAALLLLHEAHELFLALVALLVALDRVAVCALVRADLGLGQLEVDRVEQVERDLFDLLEVVVVRL